MKVFISLCSIAYILMIGAASAEPLERKLNTYSDKSTTGMELVAPAMYYVDVPPMTMVSVTVVRTAGDCDLRVKAGTGFRNGPAEWLPVVSGVEGEIASRVDKSKVTVLPPSAEAKRVYVTFDSVGKGYCGYRTYIVSSDLTAAAGRALMMTLAQLFAEHIIAEMTGVEPGDLSKNPLVERGIQAGIAALTSDDLGDFTASMLMNEIQLRVTRAIPNSHALASWVTNTMQGVASDLFKPYFNAQLGLN